VDPCDVEPAILERLSSICLALPETTVRSDRWAHAFQIRRRVFAYLLAIDDGAGIVSTLVSLRADPHERHALVSTGHPYFATNTGPSGLGLVIDGDTDWDELRELITESYRLLAPKKLSALLDETG